MSELKKKSDIENKVGLSKLRKKVRTKPHNIPRKTDNSEENETGISEIKKAILNIMNHAKGSHKKPNDEQNKPRIRDFIEKKIKNDKDFIDDQLDLAKAIEHDAEILKSHNDIATDKNSSETEKKKY